MKKAITITVICLLSLNSYLIFPQEVIHKLGEYIVLIDPKFGSEDLLESLHAKGYTDIGLASVKVLSKSLNIHLFKTDTNAIDDSQFLMVMKSHNMVQLAQFNHYTTGRSTFPNDSNFNFQWGLHNTGLSGVEDADIDAPEAWDKNMDGLTPGGDTIVIAIIDDGFDLDHIDLRFWKNRDEIPNNNMDDDNNGYIDDYNGWNAYNSTAILPEEEHGTHVSGIAAAIGNNEIGVVGVSWNTRVLAVAGSSVEESVAVEAYSYVYDIKNEYLNSNGQKGAYIVAVNSSFGVDNGKPEDFPIWCAMYDSMGALGILNVAATANKNINVDISGDIPTTCTSDYLISVTNTNKFDKKAYGSGTGLISIDLGAPGENIYSTFPDDEFANKSGTSQSAPFITGAIAGLYDVACDTFYQTNNGNPAAFALIMKDLILSTVDTIADLWGKTVSGGRLNLGNAFAKNCENIKDTINTHIGDLKLEFYPNPIWTDNGKELTVRYNFGSDTTRAMLIIRDLYGRLMGESKLQPVGNQTINESVFDISALPSGVYLITVQFGEVEFATRKFIKK